MKKTGLYFLELEDHLKKGMPTEWVPILTNHRHVIEKFMPGKAWHVEPAFNLFRNQYMEIESCVIISTDAELTKKEKVLWFENYIGLGIPEHLLRSRNSDNSSSLAEIISKIEENIAKEIEEGELYGPESMTVDKLVRMIDTAKSHRKKPHQGTAISKVGEIWDITRDSHPAYHNCLHILRLALHAQTQPPCSKNSCSFLNSVGVEKLYVNHVNSPTNKSELHAELIIRELDSYKINRLKSYVVNWCSLYYDSPEFTWLGFDLKKTSERELHFSFKEKSKMQLN